jgi:hypothetical protein
MLFLEANTNLACPRDIDFGDRYTSFLPYYTSFIKPDSILLVSLAIR